MCFSIPLGFCTIRSSQRCFLCIAPTSGVRLMPLIDLFELILTIAVLVVTFALQETWQTHYTIFVIANSLGTTIKLVGSLTIFCTGIPSSKTGKISTW